MRNKDKVIARIETQKEWRQLAPNKKAPEKTYFLNLAAIFDRPVGYGHMLAKQKREAHRQARMGSG
jgi:hypothetical protein